MLKILRILSYPMILASEKLQSPVLALLEQMPSLPLEKVESTFAVLRPQGEQ